MKVNIDPNTEKPCNAKIQSFIKEYGFDKNKEFRVSILLMELAKTIIGYENMRHITQITSL